MEESTTSASPAVGRALPEQRLSAAAADLHARIAKGDHPGAGDEQAVAELQAWGMLSRPRQSGAPMVAMPPVEAAWNVAQDALLHLQHQIQQLVELPGTVQRLELQYAQSRFRAGAGSEFIADRDEVNERIGAILDGAQTELLGAHPQGPRTRAQMEIGVPRDTAALERGVKYRTLYQDAVRDDPVTCEWASTMAPRGVHFRTLADPFERCIIVDRRIAVISNYVVEDAPAHAAWIITDRAMVAFAVHAFEQQWRRAAPWHGERRVRTVPMPGARGTLSRVQRAILRALAEGDSQESVARAMQMSKRTLQRELDAIRTLWALPQATVAQLTYRWALSPERSEAVLPVEPAA
ncbi:hypothetical protein [Streptomyces sp. Da 82-17]|uniref:hypothetical protein n=1 Tax=Streptomyces sp. Da 82-17 TaxID=3377116 RepID=UPI0038D42BAE